MDETVAQGERAIRKLLLAGEPHERMDAVELNFQLEVGGTAESVTVTGDAPLIQTNSVDLAQVIDRRFLDLLYIPDRNPLSLIGLTPGIRGGGGHPGILLDGSSVPRHK